MPQAAYFEKGSPYGDTPPVLLAPDPIEYSDLDVVTNLLHASEEGLRYATGFWKSGLDIWVAAMTGKTPPEAHVEGLGREIFLIDGRLTPTVVLDPLETWLTDEGFATERSDFTIVNNIYARIPEAKKILNDMGSDVTVIGHSLGGPLGRALGRQMPNVTHVIELSGPKWGTVNGVPFHEAKPISRDDKPVRNTNVVSFLDPIVPANNSRSLDPGANRVANTGHFDHGTDHGVRMILAGALAPEPGADLYVSGRTSRRRVRPSARRA